MKTTIKILKHLWQLPQHIVAWCLILFFRKDRFVGEYKGRRVYYHPLMPNARGEGVCLGNYIFHDSPIWEEGVIAHEYGHSVQSLWWGWLYLITVGLPSVLNARRGADYYTIYPEKQANKLGGVWVSVRGNGKYELKTY